MIYNISIPALMITVWLAGSHVLLGQIGDSVANPDTSAQGGAPSIESAVPPAAFYHPPVIREVWDEFYRLLDSQDAGALTRDFVRVLLDSLAGRVQADFDSLAIRAQAVESSAVGYTHKFYQSPLTRDQILGEPITEEIAREQPHFHATYDPQGHLLQVRYVEPRIWRTRQQQLAQGAYQLASTTPPQVRYFRNLDIRTLTGKNYVQKEELMEGRSHYRFVYDPVEAVESVLYFDSKGQWVYALNTGQPSAAGDRYTSLEFANESGSLLTLHPYIFLRDWSVVKPDWKVAITRSDSGILASVQVFNQLDMLSYYYTYSLHEDEEAGTSTLRCTALSANGAIQRVYALVFDQADRMVRRAFYTNDGQLLESMNYEYLPQSSELVVITRNALGNETARQNFFYPDQGD